MPHGPYARVRRTAVHCPLRPTQTATSSRKGFACVAGCSVPSESVPCAYPVSTLPVAARARIAKLPPPVRAASHTPSVHNTAEHSPPISDEYCRKRPRRFAAAVSTLLSTLFEYPRLSTLCVPLTCRARVPSACAAVRRAAPPASAVGIVRMHMCAYIKYIRSFCINL